MSSQNSGPNFVGIGAQKAGTTWIEHLLRSHPDVWMPPIKELHYFDELDGISSTNNILRRIFDSSWEARRWRRYFKVALSAGLMGRKDTPRDWYYRYLFAKRNDDWYAKLFPENENQVSGEITPSYQILGRERVKQIRTRFPELKLILLLRNPIERTWSQLRMDLIRNQGRHYEDVSEIEIEKFLSRDDVQSRGLGAKSISNWLSAFPENQLRVALFEEIQSHPLKLADEICQFLQIDSYSSLEMPVPGKVHIGVPAKMPASLHQRLLDMFSADIQLLKTEFGLPVDNWLG